MKTFVLIFLLPLSAFGADYVHARALRGDGFYDLDNPDRVDGGGLQIHCAAEVATALPGKTFKLVCLGTTCTFQFDGTLSGAEQTTLTDTVSDHRNNI